MAEEWVLSVGIEADVSRFRKTLRDELAAAAQQTATVPVAAATGAAGTSHVPPGGAGVSPAASVTANTVAQQSAQAAQAAAYAASQAKYGEQAANLRSWQNAPAAGSWVVGPGGQLIPSGPGASRTAAQAAAYAASQAKYGAQAASLMEWANAPLVGGGGPNPGANFGAAPVVDPGANFGAGTPGPSAQQWWNYFGGGQGGAPQSDPQQRRYNQRLRALYFANAGARLFSNETEYGKNVRMAGSDPQELIAADIKYRQGIADAFPIAGRIGMALNDMFTGGTEPVERTLRDAERQDTRTAGLQRTEAMAERFRVAGEAAGLRGSDQARFLVRAQFDKDVQTIRDERRKTADESSAKFRQQRDEVDQWYRTTPISQGGTEEERDRRMGVITQAENDSVNVRAGRFVRMMTSAGAQRNRAIADINRGVQAEGMLNFGAARGSLLRAQGRPFEASVSERFTSLGAELLTSDDNKASIGLKGAASMAELFADMFRDVSHSHRQLTAQNRITQKLLDRDPLGAKITAIQTETDEGVYALRGLPSSVRGPLEGAVRRGGALRERLERRDDDDARQLRIQSLDNRIEHFSLLAENKPLSAHARDIQRDTEQALDQARKSGRSTQEERIAILQAGIAEEYSFEKQLRRRMAAGFGTEVAAGSYAPGVSGSDTQEPVVRAIGTVKDAIEKLQSALLGVN